ncbi:MAG: (Fe-S)-binding protein [Campylobacter sp.]
MFEFTQISDKCVKCGKCIPDCTIHKISGDETTSPRGFLDLVGAYGRGELKLDKTVKDIFESCFLCTTCVEICPNSLPIDTAIENIRLQIAKKFGISWYKRLFFWLLRNRKIMDFAARLGYVFQSCGFKIQDKSMSPRFSLPMIKKERLFPTADKRSFLNSHNEFIDNGGSKTIGIFIGCMGNYAYTGVGESLLKIARELKLNVHLMKKQLCCGAPAYFTGDFATVEFLAKRNIEYFENLLKDLDAIIIPEATCSAMIKIDYEHFFYYDNHWKERAKAVSEKIFLATHYFEKFTNLAEILQKNAKKGELITYHDPCHARKMQKVYREPRNLLSKNYSIIEMSQPDSCCGFGGVTMQSQKYYLSREVGLNKARLIEETGAKFVSAECSACRLQISNALHIQNSKIKFENPIDLIAQTFEN